MKIYPTQNTLSTHIKKPNQKIFSPSFKSTNGKNLDELINEFKAAAEMITTRIINEDNTEGAKKTW